MLRKRFLVIVNGQISGEVMVGDVGKGNVVGLGGWRTYMAISPNNQVYFIRESSTDDLAQPLLKLLIPDGQGNWTGKTLAGISSANWYRLGKFLIDSAGKPHIIFSDYAYDKKGAVYTANGYGGVKHADAYHNLWYASSNSLDGTGWAQFPLTEGTIPSLYDDQYWVDLALDEKDNPAVAKWLWKVGTESGAFNTSTYFFKRDSSTWTDWSIYRATRSFDGLAIKGLKNNEQGTVSGMGPGLVKDQYGWHGVWDNSPPRPFEHANERGGIEYRFSPDGQDWSSYHVIAPFSAEGYCITKIDKQNRLNVLVLGDHTDTQLYFLRYQLPAHNWMEIFPDRRYYYNGETVTFHAQAAVEQPVTFTCLL